MSFGSRLFAMMLKLPPAETHDVAVENDIQIPMADGAILLADRYYPNDGVQRPLIMIRSPYGRSGIVGLINGRLIAERGFQVLVQSCRGTFGSEGEFNPLQQEHDDGLATVKWLKEQDWYPGQFATHGSSYQGFTQWSIAGEVGAEHVAMLTMDTSSEFHSLFSPGDGFWLELALSFVNTIDIQEGSQLKSMLSAGGPKDPMQKAYLHLPLNEADKVGIGKTVSYWQEFISHETEDDWWKKVDCRQKLPNLETPVFMISGWYDIAVAQTIRDFQLMHSAGRPARLTIGPWVHGDMKSVTYNFGEALAWFRAHLLEDKSGIRENPVQIYVMGADEWRNLPNFPPKDVQTQHWYLQPEGVLSTELAPASEPDAYRYDPANPTPNVGGATLLRNNGPKDNRKLEARDDVLIYTSAVLERPLTIIGATQAELYLKSNLEYTDCFARLCDVDPKGKSTNICDMLVRLFPGKIEPELDGCLKVVIELTPTAYQFQRGHQIRLQVSSGAFPRWSRNLGSGEPLATATTMKIAQQTVYHDPDHPSAIILPIENLKK